MSLSILAILTEATCAEGCWYAHEDICRCSCDGRNHGCLRTADGQRPERTAKIDGKRYVLKAVGGRDVYGTASALLKTLPPYRTEEIKQDGKVVYTYRYTWKETDKGSPVRVKYASKAQLAKWPELSSFRDRERLEQFRNPAMLLWIREDQTEFLNSFAQTAQVSSQPTNTPKEIEVMPRTKTATKSTKTTAKASTKKAAKKAKGGKVIKGTFDRSAAAKKAWITINAKKKAAQAA